MNCFAPYRMRDSDYRTLPHARVLHQNGLYLEGVDVLTARDDHVFDAVRKIDITLCVHTAPIPGMHPAASNGCGGRVGAVPISEHDPRSSNCDFSDFARRQRISGLAKYAHFTPEHGSSDGTRQQPLTRDGKYA